MRSKYKKVILWSSIGSLAVGAAVALARRPRRIASAPLVCRKIPQEFQRILLWTEQFERVADDVRHFAHDRYQMQPTPFKVWSVIDLPLHHSPGRSGSEGAPIHHFTHTRLLEDDLGAGGEAAGMLLDRFYGIVTVLDSSGKSCGMNSIARGGFLEIRKCFVGGSANGVESGEVHRSQTRILNYRIDYTNA